MEKDTIERLLLNIELQLENWGYDEIDLINCNAILVDEEGYRYDGIR